MAKKLSSQIQVKSNKAKKISSQIRVKSNIFDLTPIFDLKNALSNNLPTPSQVCLEFFHLAAVPLSTTSPDLNLGALCRMPIIVS